MNSPFDSGEEQIEQQFSGLSILQAEVTAVTFEECTFTHCNFSETQFKRCTFRDCQFHNCDLTLLDVDYSRFQRCKFTECKLIGINWTKAGRIQRIEFHDCNLSYNTFMELDLSQAVLSHCLAKEATFAETNLTDANCTHTDFLDGRFIHTNLTRTDFRGAKNYAIAAAENTLKQTKFSLPEAIALLDGLDIILENPTY
ncbi:MAG: pentapeptide repeat-containing protein, partial [Candidatus Promineifilaceae bacterium]